MDALCDQVLASAPDALPPALAEHARHCERCKGFLSTHRALGGFPGTSAQAASGPMPPALAEAAARAPGRWWMPLAMLLSVEGLVAAGAVLAMRHGAAVGNQSPTAVVWGMAALMAIAMVLWGTAAFARDGIRMSGLAALLVVAVAIAIGPAGSGIAAAGPFSAGIRCTISELVVALLPAGWALWMMTRFAFQPLRAWLGGASASAAGLLALHFHCPNGSAEHLIVFHLVPWLMLGVLFVPLRRALPSQSFAP